MKKKIKSNATQHVVGQIPKHFLLPKHCSPIIEEGGKRDVCVCVKQNSLFYSHETKNFFFHSLRRPICDTCDVLR